MPKFDLNTIIAKSIEWGPRVIGLVKAAKAKWGSSKSGAEKFEAVRDTIIDPDADDAIEVLEGVTNKDIVNDAALQALVNESIQVAYDVMKGQERLKAIAAQMKALKPQPQG